MLVPLPSYRLPIALALLAAMFGAYGAHGIVQAQQYGTSLRYGTESLVVAAVLASILVVLLVVKHRRSPERPWFSNRS